jgi:hypothetical protein
MQAIACPDLASNWPARPWGNDMPCLSQFAHSCSSVNLQHAAKQVPSPAIGEGYKPLQWRAQPERLALMRLPLFGETPLSPSEILVGVREGVFIVSCTP